MSPYLKVHKLHPIITYIYMYVGLYNLSHEYCGFACAEWDILVVSNTDFPNGKKVIPLHSLMCLRKTFLSRSRTHIDSFFFA
jgi:hypothetical protein